MANYQIITDSGCDLPCQMIDNLGLKMLPMNINFRGQLLDDSVDRGIKEIYDGLRSGEMATTCAVNPSQWASIIEPSLKEERDVLVMAFSSGLSTTYQSAVIAANELQEAYPQRKIRVVDTRSASLGQGLLTWYACKKRDEGMGIEELTAWLNEYKFKLAHWFTVDDLGFLKRGGRISATTAVVGTMLQIKPVLHMDDEGHLISMSKARGRKASLDALVAKMGQTGLPGQNDTVFICHGDCIKDAEYVKKQVMEKYGVKEVFIGYTGAVIGSHSGPGTLALFFLAEHR